MNNRERMVGGRVYGRLIATLPKWYVTISWSRGLNPKKERLLQALGWLTSGLHAPKSQSAGPLRSMEIVLQSLLSGIAWNCRIGLSASKYPLQLLRFDADNRTSHEHWSYCKTAFNSKIPTFSDSHSFNNCFHMKNPKKLQLHFPQQKSKIKRGMSKVK